MTDNVFEPTIEDEVISEEDQSEDQYDADTARGYALGLEHKRMAYEIVGGLNNAEEDGFWDGYYD